MFQSISDRIAANAEHRYQGMAVADFDGDGEQELFICVAGSANRLLKWVDGRVVNVTPPILGDGSTFAKSAMAADVDGDGLEELYVVNTSPLGREKPTPDRLFSVQPNHSWVELFTNIVDPKLRNLVTGTSVAAIDRRGNGRYTFVVCNDRRPMRWYELGPSGQLLDLAPPFRLNMVGETNWVGPVTSLLPELLVLTSDGENRLLTNSGDGRFDCQNAYFPFASGSGSQALGVDGNDDGRFHLAWSHRNEPHRLLVRQIDGRYKDEATLSMAMPSQCSGIIAADFDNDGYEELIFLNDGESNRGFRRDAMNEPTWRKFDIGDLTESTLTTTGAAIADIDGDGVLELVRACSHRGRLMMHKIATASNNWVRIAPLTRFGAPARGATVLLQAGNRKQIRVISGGGSPFAMEPIAHFGLGEVRTIDRITITWPDGAKQTLDHPNAQTLHRITYPFC